jgi:ABC-type glutathione transport system ATPase component
MIILDDVLSALDATTEGNIFAKLLGPKGMLKSLGTTVLLISHMGMALDFLSPIARELTD